MKRAIAIVSAVLGLVVVLACGGTEKAPSSQPQNTGPRALQGTLLVGTDITPGVYMGTATAYCYIERNASNGDIISNDLYEEGDSVLLRVAETDYSVKIDKACGLTNVQATKPA